MSAVTRAPRQWTQDDIGFVSAIAAQASIAIHNAELFEKSEGLARELRGLVDMSSDLAVTLDSAHVADRIAHHLAAATDVPSCRISYLDRDTNRLVALGHYPAAETWAFSGGDPLNGPAARRALAEQIAMDAVARHEPTGPRVHLGLLPLVAKGESIGLVELASDRAEPLDRTPARAGSDDGQRGGDGARERPPLRGRAQPGRPRPVDRASSTIGSSTSASARRSFARSAGACRSAC